MSMPLLCCFWGHGRCVGRVQKHHVIPRQELRKRHAGATHSQQLRLDPPELKPLRTWIADERNIVGLCFHHHQQLTNARIYLRRSMLPSGIDDFASETGLDWFLVKHFPKEEQPSMR